MCLLRKYGLTILPILDISFMFQNKGTFILIKIFTLSGGTSNALFKFPATFWEKTTMSIGDFSRDWSMRSRDQNGGLWLAWSLDGWHAERRCEGWSSFFLLKKCFCTAFFPVYSKIARELQEAVNLEMSASVLFTANPPYGSDWQIQGNFALRWTQLRCLRCLHEVVN